MNDLASFRKMVDDLSEQADALCAEACKLFPPGTQLLYREEFMDAPAVGVVRNETCIDPTMLKITVSPTNQHRKIDVRDVIGLV